MAERFTYMRHFLGSGRLMVKPDPNWISFGSQYFKNSELVTNNLKVRKWHIKNAEFLLSLGNEVSPVNSPWLELSGGLPFGRCTSSSLEHILTLPRPWR